MTEDAPNGAQGPARVEPAAPAPQQPGRSRLKHSKLKLGIVAAVSGVIVVGGGVAVANAAAGGAVAQQGPGGGRGGYGGPGGAGVPGGGNLPGGGRGGVERGGLVGALHGDFVVKDSSGKYVTMRLQTGTVTAVSDTSITAKSEDGHSATFAVNGSTKVNGSATIGDVKTGATVTIVGTVDGDTATATSITDASQRRQPRGTATPRPTRTA